MKVKQKSIQSLEFKAKRSKDAPKPQRLDYEWGYYQDDEKDIVSLRHDYEYSSENRYFS